LTSPLDHTLDLEEASQPPDLKEGLANDDTNNKHVPPLDSAVCALGGVSVSALTDNDILLLVLDLGKEIGQFADYSGIFCKFFEQLQVT
jgi:hypothetical protein